MRGHRSSSGPFFTQSPPDLVHFQPDSLDFPPEFLHRGHDIAASWLARLCGEVLQMSFKLLGLSGESLHPGVISPFSGFLHHHVKVLEPGFDAEPLHIAVSGVYLPLKLSDIPPQFLRLFASALASRTFGLLSQHSGLFVHRLDVPHHLADFPFASQLPFDIPGLIPEPLGFLQSPLFFCPMRLVSQPVEMPCHLFRCIRSVFPLRPTPLLGSAVGVPSHLNDFLPATVPICTSDDLSDLDNLPLHPLGVSRTSLSLGPTVGQPVEFIGFAAQPVGKLLGLFRASAQFPGVLAQQIDGELRSGPEFKHRLFASWPFIHLGGSNRGQRNHHKCDNPQSFCEHKTDLPFSHVGS